MEEALNDNARRYGGILAFLSGVFRHAKKRRDLEAMLSLDDHILEDIGVTRFDIQEAICAGGELKEVVRKTFERDHPSILQIADNGRRAAANDVEIIARAA